MEIIQGKQQKYQTWQDKFVGGEKGAIQGEVEEDQGIASVESLDNGPTMESGKAFSKFGIATNKLCHNSPSNNLTIAAEYGVNENISPFMDLELRDHFFIPKSHVVNTNLDNLQVSFPKIINTSPFCIIKSPCGKEELEAIPLYLQM